jgi:hypothetical protein
MLMLSASMVIPPYFISAADSVELVLITIAAATAAVIKRTQLLVFNL